MQGSPVQQFNGALDMPPQLAASYVDGKLYLIEVTADGRRQAVRARPYYRRLLRSGKVRVFFRTSSLELVAGRAFEFRETAR